MRLLAAPLLLLAAAPVLVTEMGRIAVRQLMTRGIADALYMGHAAFGLVEGHTPYLIGFMTAPDQHVVFLYPPLTLILIVPPVLAGSHYAAGFSIEVLVLTLAGVVTLGWACRRSGIGAPVGMAAGVLLVAIGPVLVTRLDAVQGLLVAGAALALMRQRNLTAVALVSLAVLVKETAVLAALPVGLWCLLPYEGATSTFRQRLGQVGLGVLPALAIFAIFAIWSRGGEITAALTSVHRGLEIESIPATIVVLLRHFYPVHPYFGRLSSWQLAAPDAGMVAGVVTVVGAAVILGGAVLFARRRSEPATAIAFCVAVGLCATPVFSPQYLLDLLPVLALAALVEFPRRRMAPLLLLGLVIALLTQADFPYLFYSVVTLQPLGTAVVAVRNLLLIVLAVELARPLLHIPRRERAAVRARS